MQSVKWRGWIAAHHWLLLVVGIALVVLAALEINDIPLFLRPVIRDIGFLLALAFFAVEFIEHPLREETARGIRETAARELEKLKEQTVDRLLRGWLPPAHFALLQKTTLQPFMREDMYYLLRLSRAPVGGVEIPVDLVVEFMEYRYRVRNLSEMPASAEVGISMSKEREGVLPGFPNISLSGMFPDGTLAFTVYSGPGEDKGEYRDCIRNVQIPGNSSVSAEVYTRELRALDDREVLVCPMPAEGIVVDIHAPGEFEITAEALQPGPAQLQRTPHPSGEGLRFVLPSPVLPGAVIEVKWRRKPEVPA